MKLNELRDNKGAYTKKTRLGRGVGSGKGKTSGKGVKGQKARAGVAINGFEGGQMPLYQRLPKRGFNKPDRARYVELDLKRLQGAIDAKKLDAKSPIDEDALVAAGVVRRKRDGVRLLANGALKTKISLTVTGASKAAVAAVEKAGGAVTILKAPKAPAEETA
jgi:large subunit ribosomal protein L15